jgi:hypothetical protein
MYPQACGQIGGQFYGIKLETAEICGFSFEPLWLIDTTVFSFNSF